MTSMFAFAGASGIKAAIIFIQRKLSRGKKALHYARVYGDFSLMNEFGINTDGTRIDIKKERHGIQRKIYQMVFKKCFEKSGGL